MWIHGVTQRERVASIAAAATGFVLYVVLARFFAKQTGDDSFIFYRIADNVLAGHGPVFNPGEAVEAYSSPLWLLVLVVGRALGAPYGPFGQVLGGVLAAGGIVAGVVCARRLGAGPLAAALVGLFASISGSVHYWAPSGLETSLYAAVLGGACAAIALGRPWPWAIAAALLGVTRPEGIFLLPIAVAAYLLAHRRRALPVTAIVVAAAPAVAYEVFRLAYFHAPLPNTYYAKATGPLWDRVQTGLDYAFWPLVVLVPSALLALRSYRRKNPLPLAVLLLPGAVTGAAIVGGGDWMWGHRLLVPALAPLLGVAVAQVSTLLAERSPALRIAATVGVLFTALNDDFAWPERLGYEEHFGFNPWNRVLKFKDWEDYRVAADLRFLRPLRTIGAAIAGKTMSPGDRMEGTLTEASREAGEWLKSRYPAGTLLAVNHAGALPYYAGFPAVDMTGLADWHIAHEVHGGLHHKYDPDYVLRRRPRVVVLNARVEPGKDGVWYHEGYWEGETALVKHPEFAARYHALPTYFRWEYSDKKGNYILLYERNEP